MDAVNWFVKTQNAVVDVGNRWQAYQGFVAAMRCALQVGPSNSERLSLLFGRYEALMWTFR